MSETGTASDEFPHSLRRYKFRALPDGQSAQAIHMDSEILRHITPTNPQCQEDRNTEDSWLKC